MKFIKILNEDYKKEDISLNSIKIQKTLNKDIWDEKLKLNKEFRKKCLSIAKDFIKSFELKKIIIKDVILTGSICNYNWSKYSDVDIHILIDFKKINKDVDFIADYFKDKKNIWKIQHTDLKLYGFQVELYVQDTNEEHNANATFSLVNNKWIGGEPTLNQDFTELSLDEDFIRQTTADFINKIDYIEKQIKIHKKNPLKLKNFYKDLEKIKKEIVHNRRLALKTKKKEMHELNIVFKLLRRKKCLDKIFLLQDKLYDSINSIY